MTTTPFDKGAFNYCRTPLLFTRRGMDWKHELSSITLHGRVARSPIRDRTMMSDECEFERNNYKQHSTGQLLNFQES
ncbi:unnamed protein product [Fusarium graminearum]|uniref:Chromosome 2, complete genome n=1 Tax=Gibberella zeae (strain ATCC MYA-4620 / CBS 123657 / FGSC 9075 / NRRL 31084 / PH-1) TaxID=229533 RepID=A0A098DEC8_GIBZE|nr:unnamed protein product [Fusarium graminearum]